MSEIEMRKSAYQWLDEYANSPVKMPTKEHAIERLKKIGVLTKNGRIAKKYKGLIVSIK